MGASQTPQRTCDGCTLCCKVLGISEIQKPQGQWCQHCTVGEGCQIYETRPGECRTFNCAWLTDPGLNDEWAPKRSRLVVAHTNTRIAVHCDPARPGAWRKPPFYQTIRNWAAAFVPRGGQVVVFEGLDAVAILPDREKPLGRVSLDQAIVSTRRDRVQGGTDYDVIVLQNDDPRLQQLLKK